MPFTSVGAEMGEFKSGSLHSGSSTGPVVKDRKQAIAIALSEARKAGKKVAPPKKSAATQRQAIGSMLAGG